MLLLLRVVEEIAEQFRSRSAADGVQLTWNVHALPVSPVLAQAAIHDVTLLIEHLLSFVPEGGCIQLTTADTGPPATITITGEGINLSSYTGILSGCTLPVEIKSLSQGDFTHYQLTLLEMPEPKHDPPSQNNFYLEIQKRLRSHFNRGGSVMDRLRGSPREAAFMARVHAVINNNMSDSKFDVNKLADAMNLSRTQLFRKLKPIIGQSAAGYIRSLRLKKAKELLETTELRVNEVAFLTGFETPSHFTKVFARAFGIRPSVIARNQHYETNEP
jgi:AraC-like DNA-binding protein